MNVRVEYHVEESCWWADSPDVPGWTASDDTYDALRERVREGLFFATGRYPALRSGCVITSAPTPILEMRGSEEFTMIAAGE